LERSLTDAVRTVRAHLLNCRRSFHYKVSSFQGPGLAPWSSKWFFIIRLTNFDSSTPCRMPKTTTVRALRHQRATDRRQVIEMSDRDALNSYTDAIRSGNVRPCCLLLSGRTAKDQVSNVFESRPDSFLNVEFEYEHVLLRTL
jgi:hypothetical protein